MSPHLYPHMNHRFQYYSRFSVENFPVLLHIVFEVFSFRRFQGSFRPSRALLKLLLRRIKCPDRGFIHSCISSPVNLVLASYLVSTLIAD